MAGHDRCARQLGEVAGHVDRICPASRELERLCGLKLSALRVAQHVAPRVAQLHHCGVRACFEMIVTRRVGEDFVGKGICVVRAVAAEQLGAECGDPGVHDLAQLYDLRVLRDGRLERDQVRAGARTACKLGERVGVVGERTQVVANAPRLALRAEEPHAGIGSKLRLVQRSCYGIICRIVGVSACQVGVCGCGGVEPACGVGEHHVALAGGVARHEERDTAHRLPALAVHLLKREVAAHHLVGEGQLAPGNLTGSAYLDRLDGGVTEVSRARADLADEVGAEGQAGVSTVSVLIRRRDAVAHGYGLNRRCLALTHGFEGLGGIGHVVYLHVFLTCVVDGKHRAVEHCRPARRQLARLGVHLAQAQAAHEGHLGDDCRA